MADIQFNYDTPPPELTQPSPTARAIFGQESSGGIANTSSVNSQGVTGPMQIKDTTWKLLQNRGIIPKEYNWRDPNHNRDAGFKYVDWLEKKYGGDVDKVAAAYYGGEGAVNKDGTINRHWKNHQRPNDPTVGQYADQVRSRMTPPAKSESGIKFNYDAPPTTTVTDKNTWGNGEPLTSAEQLFRNVDEFKNEGIGEKLASLYGGPLETVASLTSGLPGFVAGSAGKAVAGGKALLQGRLPTAQDYSQGAESATPQWTKDITYEPRTAGGKVGTGAISEGFETIGKGLSLPGAGIRSTIDRVLYGHNKEQQKENFWRYYDMMSPSTAALFEIGMVGKIGRDGFKDFQKYRENKAAEQTRQQREKEAREAVLKAANENVPYASPIGRQEPLAPSITPRDEKGNPLPQSENPAENIPINPDYVGEPRVRDRTREDLNPLEFEKIAIEAEKIGLSLAPKEYPKGLELERDPNRRGDVQQPAERGEIPDLQGRERALPSELETIPYSRESIPPPRPRELELQGIPFEELKPSDLNPRGNRDRLEGYDTTLDPSRPARAGEMTPRQGIPYEQMPLPRNERTPQQLELTEGPKPVSYETLPYEKGLSDRGSVGEARSQIAERNQRIREQEALTAQGESYKGQGSLFRGPGRRQAGALRLDQLFQKKGVAQTLLEQRKTFNEETRPAQEVMLEMVDKESKDISELDGRRIGGNTLVPKQVAILTQHPLTKWAVDKVEDIDRRGREEFRSAIDGKRFEKNQYGLEHRVPSNEGGLVQFRKMYHESRGGRAELSEMKDIWMDRQGGSPLTPNDFRTPRQWEVYSAMRNVLDDRIEKTNARRSASELPPIQFLENYFPAIWEGDFFIRVKDSNGVTRHMASANSQRLANKFKEDLEKQYKDNPELGPDYKVEVNPTEKSRYDISDTSAWEEAAEIMAHEGDTAASQLFNKIYSDVMTHRGGGRHGIKKTFVDGFMGMEKGNVGLRNTDHAFETYVNKMIRYEGNLEKAALKAELLRLPEDFKQEHPNALKWINDHLDQSKGKALSGGDVVQAGLSVVARKFGLGEHSFNRGISNLNAMILPMWLLTPRQAFVNIAQPIMNIPRLSRMEATGELKGSPVSHFVKGYSDFVSKTPETVEALNWATREGFLDPTITSLLDMKLSEASSSTMKAARDVLRMPFSTIESRLVRGPSFAIFERAFREEMPELTKLERYKKAAQAMDDTMVNYNPTNLPHMYNRMGIAGDATKGLKQFAHNELGALLDYIHFAKDYHEVKPLAYYLGVKTVMSGMKGLPLVAEVAAAVALLNMIPGLDLDIPNPQQLMDRISWLPDVMVMGFASTILGYDISTASDAPAINKMLGAPAIELGAKAVSESVSFLFKYFTGKATDKDKLDALKATTPAGPLHSIFENIYTDDNGFQTNSKGEALYQRSQEEKIIGGLSGLRSTQRDGLFSGQALDSLVGRMLGKGERGEAQARALISGANQLIMLDAHQRIKMMDSMVDHVKNHTPIPPELIQEYMSRGGTASRLRQDIEKHMKMSALTPLERLFEKGRPTPNKVQKYERMKEQQDIRLRDEGRSSEPLKFNYDAPPPPPDKRGSTESGIRQVSNNDERSPTPKEVSPRGDYKEPHDPNLLGYSIDKYNMPVGRAGSRGTYDRIPNANQHGRTKDSKGRFRGETYL